MDVTAVPASCRLRSSPEHLDRNGASQADPLTVGAKSATACRDHVPTNMSGSPTDCSGRCSPGHDRHRSGSKKHTIGRRFYAHGMAVVARVRVRGGTDVAPDGSVSVTRNREHIHEGGPAV